MEKNILDNIIAHKQNEVAALRAFSSPADFEASPLFGREVVSTRQWLQRPDKTGIIAEFKRKSPSKGIINDKAQPERVGELYAEGGASAISVLTDRKFFGGSLDDLIAIRKSVDCPILRKDFIIDEVQILEAKAAGADLILLIAANLKVEKLKTLAAFAKSLKMEVLLEVHSLEELQSHLNDSVDIVGVNNRNLKTFAVSLETSEQLAEHIPQAFLRISESGISTVADLSRLRQCGYQGFLIGENFMKDAKPGLAFKEFVGPWQNILQPKKTSQTPE